MCDALSIFKGSLCTQLQDRTQFSDGDVHTLKRYWDNGMTSLGSVCREKISAAATELSVDSEIIKVCQGPVGCPLKMPDQTNNKCHGRLGPFGVEVRCLSYTESTPFPSCSGL